MAPKPDKLIWPSMMMIDLLIIVKTSTLLPLRDSKVTNYRNRFVSSVMIMISSCSIDDINSRWCDIKEIALSCASTMHGGSSGSSSSNVVVDVEVRGLR